MSTKKYTLKQAKNYTLFIDISALPLSPLEEVQQAAGSRSEPTASTLSKPHRPPTAALGWCSKSKGYSVTEI